MTTAIQKHMRDFIAVIVLFIIALFVGGYILSNQRFYLPAWVPFVGTDFFELKAEFATAQSVTPGQGQTVNVAGVPVGEIAKVELKDGRALVTMSIKQRYAKLVKSDATMLLRPKTGLKDMIIEMDPGEPKAASVEEGHTIPVAQTKPDVNLDEILSVLDRPTRTYLRLLVAGGAEGLKDNAPALSSTLRRFEPLSRDVATISGAISERRRKLARLVHNLQLLITAVGGKDKDLAELVVSQNAVFEAFANEDEKLRETLRLLPDALSTTQTALTKSAAATDELTPTLAKLRPGARALADAQKALRPFARQTTPVIRKQLRPFARQAQGPVDNLRPAASNLAKATPNLTKTFTLVNKLLNGLAYNPKGQAEGFLFYALWLNHIGSSVYSTQDAFGPIRRGVILTDCVALGALEATRQIDNQLGTLIDLTNLPTEQEACPGGSG
jgi:phospholipid/cholesterol/gamma-HCH transport system substrate-binding protein